MTNITFRKYQGPEDLQRQYDFWISLTRNLPWCWKPTLSPEIFLKETNYDPQTRWFAFDGDNPIYAAGVQSMEAATHSIGTNFTIMDSFDFSHYRAVSETTSDIEPGQMEMLQEYYTSVDYDFSLRAHDSESLGYFGVTIRKDTGFAEINAAAFDQQNIRMFVSCISAIAAYGVR